MELARAEAIRWYARDQGAIPFTSGEAAKAHVKNAAKDTGVAVLVFFALAAGGGECLWDCGIAPASVLSREDWRWAVTAADRRVVGLLELKQAKHCDTRVVAGGDGVDLGIFAGIETGRRDRTAGRIDEAARLTEETAWLDKLSPAPLRARDQSGLIVDYGEGAVRNMGNASWMPGVDLSHLEGSPTVLEGTILLTEKSIILRGKPDNGAASELLARVPYADMVSVEMKSKLGTHWVLVAQTNGHVDSFWLIHRIMGDVERTEELGALLKSKVPAQSAHDTP